MLYWIYDVPRGWLALLFSHAFIAFNSAGVLFVRSYGPLWLLGHSKSDNELIGFILGAVGVFYGLLLFTSS